jgi:hypothetical protein
MFSAAFSSQNKLCSFGVLLLTLGLATKHSHCTAGLVWFPRTHSIISYVFERILQARREMVFLLVLFNGIKGFLTDLAELAITTTSESFLLRKLVLIGNQSFTFRALALNQEVEVISREHECQQHRPTGR